MKQDSYDLIIVGAGLIGLTLCYALRNTPFRIALINDKPLTVHADTRSLGLTYASKKIFEQIGLWPDLEDKAHPLTALQITNQGHFGQLNLAADDFDTPTFGYTLPFSHLQQTLLNAIKQQHHVVHFIPKSIQQLQTSDQLQQVQLNDGSWLNGKLLIGADGTRSATRDMLGITCERHDYQQTALVCNVKFSKSNPGIAYERFLKSGLLAVLPRSTSECGLIWASTPEQIENHKTRHESQQQQQLQTLFGYRLGHLKEVGPSQSFPLIAQTAHSCVDNRSVLLGNAANTLHPVAAQGFNLGLRDIAVLVNMLKQSDDPGSSQRLQHYAEQRQTDHRHIFRLTDGLMRIFTSQHLPWIILRNLALVGLNLMPTCQQKLVDQILQKNFINEFEHA